MSAPTRLVLIRHGESVAQVEGFLSGHDTCRGLSELGRLQAEALRDRFARSGELASTDALYTSVLERTIATAAILHPALGAPAPEAECEWCEIHPGDAEGLTWDEFRARYPQPDGAFDPYRRRGPGSETWAELFARAGTRLRRVASEHPGEIVVVVGHGGVIGASFVALGDVPLRRGIDYVRETRNTSITEWRHDDTGWRLVRFNDAAHLDAGGELA